MCPSIHRTASHRQQSPHVRPAAGVGMQPARTSAGGPISVAPGVSPGDSAAPRERINPARGRMCPRLYRFTGVRQSTAAYSTRGAGRLVFEPLHLHRVSPGATHIRPAARVGWRSNRFISTGFYPGLPTFDPRRGSAGVRTVSFPPGFTRGYLHSTRGAGRPKPVRASLSRTLRPGLYSTGARAENVPASYRYVVCGPLRVPSGFPCLTNNRTSSASPRLCGEPS